jgi:CheY-like chemotaxis protein
MSALVLLVEDEALIRMLAVDILENAGFTVVDAGHAREALEYLHAKSSDIAIMITDVQMPGSMDGLDLAHHARTHWPWIAVLIVSGHLAPLSGAMPAGSRFLPKPYQAEGLVTAVRELTAA